MHRHRFKKIIFWGGGEKHDVAKEGGCEKIRALNEELIKTR